MAARSALSPSFIVLYRRALRASKLIPVPYVRRKTAANFRDAFHLYSEPRYNGMRAELFEKTKDAVEVLEKLVASEQDQLALLFRKGALDEAKRTEKRQTEERELRRSHRSSADLSLLRAASSIVTPTPSTITNDDDPNNEVCSACGTAFNCGAKGASREKGSTASVSVSCWCMRLPPILPVPLKASLGHVGAPNGMTEGTGSGCLCESCLQQRAEAAKATTTALR